MNKTLQLSSQSAPTISSRIFHAMNNTKIRDMADPYTPLNHLVAKLLLLYNVKTEDRPDEAYHRIMLEGLSKYHGNWTVEEIYLACELNLHNKLFTKVEHFGRITADFISSVLHCYSEEKKSAVLKEKARQEKHKTNDLSYGYTPIAMWQGAVEYVKVTNELPMYWNWDKAYTHLHDAGKLDYLTLEEKLRIKELMTTQVQAEQNKTMRSAGDMISYRKAKGAELEELIKNECKKYVVLNHLKQYLNHEQPNL